uniref:Uncharacterized protein n=1 Tax=Brassica oleracea var. oleracea TaxID=109376 RepID=A0A0D3BD63_BRAOL
MSKNASIDERPRRYPDEALPRYIPRTFPTNMGSSEFPRKFVSSEFRRKISMDFRGNMKFRGIISDDLFRRRRATMPTRQNEAPLSPAGNPEAERRNLAVSEDEPTKKGST